MNQEIQRTSNRQGNDALTQTLLACSTPSEIALVTEMYVTAANAKVELDQYLNRSFLEEFASQSPEAIKWVFHEWRAQSPFQPAISDIWVLIGRYHERRQIDLADEQRQRDKAETARRLVAGEQQVPWEEFRKLLAGAVKKMDDGKITTEHRNEVKAKITKRRKK